jgi:hypothetical protein
MHDKDSARNPGKQVCVPLHGAKKQKEERQKEMKQGQSNDNPNPGTGAPMQIPRDLMGQISGPDNQQL